MERISQHLYEFGPFRLNTAERLLLRNGQRVPLTPKVFETLVALIEHRGHLIEKDKLMKLVWPDSFVEEANLTNNVSTLRKALGEGETGQSYIETIPRIGYRFTAQVREVPRLVTELVVEKHSLTRIETEETEEDTLSESVAHAAPSERIETVPRWAAPSSREKAWSRWKTPLAGGALCLVIAAGMLTLYRPWTARDSGKSATAPRPPRTIAVLPFKTIGGGVGDEEYLGLGMTDALITRLGHSRQIVVRPTSAVRRYTDPHQDPVAAGRQQGVEAVLDGSIQRSGDRLRVTVQLINVAGGESIWSGQFDEPLTDIFAVQDSISRRVMSDLLVDLNPEERARFSRHGTESAEAYREYLKGRFFWNKRTNEGNKKAIEHFNRAIELDPAYAAAYAGLADAALLLAPGQPEALAKGRVALKKAVELDEMLAEPHATLGMLASNFDHDWAKAEREYRRAIELNPNYATAHHRYGEFLALMGRFDEGLAEIKRAQELDPLSLIISTNVGTVYYLARQYDKAIEQCKKTLEMDPNYGMAHVWLGFAYSAKDLHEEAIAEFHQAEGFADDGIFLSWLGYVYGVAGRRAEAKRVLKRLTVLSMKTYVPPSGMVLVHIGLGEKDEAFKWAERMFEEQDFGVPSLKVSPLLDSLRSDPRYAELLRRANFPVR